MSGIELRPATVDDFPALVELTRRADALDGVPRVFLEDDLADELDDVEVVLATDTRVALVDGERAGYAHTVHLPADEGWERCYAFGTVDPAHRGRGVGRALLAWGVERGTDQLRSSGRTLPRYLRVDAYDFQEANHRLFARFGFEPVRVFEELLRPLTDRPEVPEIPGVRIEPWPADRDEDIRTAKNVAFADHWGSTPTSPDHWHRLARGFGSWAERSFVAVDAADGSIVGHCLNHRYPDDDEALGRRDGWIDSLGTLPAWRGQGLASALIATSFRAFADAGLTHASITVDSDSLTGAARLYRSLGFVLRQRSITREIVVT